MSLIMYKPIYEFKLSFNLIRMTSILRIYINWDEKRAKLLCDWKFNGVSTSFCWCKQIVALFTHKFSTITPKVGWYHG